MRVVHGWHGILGHLAHTFLRFRYVDPDTYLDPVSESRCASMHIPYLHRCTSLSASMHIRIWIDLDSGSAV